MDPDAFRELKEDIQAHGVIVPVLTYRGEIIDGRHRWRACMELGIPCPTEEWTPATGGSVGQVVASLNLRRRHLSASQLAVITRDLLPMFAEAHKQGDGKLSDFAGSMMGVSGAYVRRAAVVGKLAPDLLPRVRDGSLNLEEARRIAKGWHAPDWFAAVEHAYNMAKSAYRRTKADTTFPLNEDPRWPDLRREFLVALKRFVRTARPAMERAKVLQKLEQDATAKTAALAKAVPS